MATPYLILVGLRGPRDWLLLHSVFRLPRRDRLPLHTSPASPRLRASAGEDCRSRSRDIRPSSCLWTGCASWKSRLAVALRAMRPFASREHVARFAGFAFAVAV